MRRFVVIVPALFAFVLAGYRAGAQAPSGSFVRVATWEGGATTLPGRLWIRPAGVDLAPGGRLFVSDARLRRVEVLGADGTPVLSFGRGGGAEDLVTPGHLAVDEARDRVYIADAGAGRVAVYTTAGAPVALWSNVGTPCGVAVAPDGRVVVSDVESHRVHVLAPDGTEVGTWGGEGTKPTELTWPAGVHVTADGTVWTVDRGNVRLVATTLDGKVVTTLKLDSASVAGADPLDVTFVDDDLWVALDTGLARFEASRGTYSARGVLRGFSATAVTAGVGRGIYVAVEPDEGPPGVWHYRNGQSSGDPIERWGGAATVPGFFDRLESVTIGDDAHAWLLDVPPRIQRFGLAGAASAQIDAPDPVEVDADADGRAYAAAGDRLYAYAADGALRWDVRMRATGTPADEIAVVGVAWDAVAQRVCVLESASGRMFVFDEVGTQVSDRTVASDDPSHEAWSDLAVGSDGTRYVLDAGAGQVRGFDGYDRKVLEVDLPEYATRLDVAPDGTLFLLSPDGWVRQIARDGRVVAAWDATRLDLGRGSRPVDVAVDAGGRVYVADGAADVVTVFEWDAGATAPVRTVPETGCRYQPDKAALPGEIVLGETVEVSLVVRGSCAPDESAADIALVVDTGMERSMLKSARASAEAFLDMVDPASDQVAIMPGGRLSNDVQLLRRQVRRLEAGAFGLNGTIEAAGAELFGRRGRTGVKKVMIVLVGSTRDEDVSYWEWWRIQRTAGEYKRRGAEIFAIAFGRLADKGYLSELASGRDHVYESAGTWKLTDVYRQIAGEVKPSELLAELIVTDEIPANMAYVEGSAAPPASLADRTLVWRLRQVPLAGAGVRYRLRPLEPGDWPTNVRAWGDYVDPAGKTGRLDFPVPRVRVAAPPPTATSTPPPTPTIELTPTPRPSATDTAVPTVDATGTAEATETPTPGTSPGGTSILLPALLADAGW